MAPSPMTERLPRLESNITHQLPLVAESTPNFTRALLLVVIFTCIIGTYHLWQTWYRLRHIPGPFLASITNFQRMSWVRTKKAHLILQEQHEKYGELVRIGPNTVSFSNPNAIPEVYPMRTGFPKSLLYRTLQPYTRTGGSLHAVFNTQDEALHKTIKSPIASLYSNTNVLSSEGLVDDVITVFQDKLDNRFSATGETFDLGQWLQFFAFDVMGTMTFSKRYGFLDQECDVGGMLGAITLFMRSSAPFTQIAWLDKLMNKNKIGDSIRQFFKKTASLTVIEFVGNAIRERRQKIADGKGPILEQANGQKDFLARFLEIQESNPSIPSWAPTAWTFSNVMAGSDTVGTVMRTTMYNLLCNPRTLSKLSEELRGANLTTPIPAFTEIRDLPYLDACINEASRVHPPFALPFERVVPEGGVTVLGKFLPGGTVIGGNPYVVNRDQATFGRDAEYWRPERWLEGDEAHRRRLERAMLTYGAGRRVCMGRAIALFEIKKIVAFLLTNYDIRIMNKEKFEVENSWLFIQKGLYAQIERRVDPANVTIQ